MSSPRTVLLKVFRYGPDDAAPRYDQFRVPAGPRTTVLDALLAIRRRQDPSLTVRHSCLHGSCGTCGMRVNGREVLACVTRLDGTGRPGGGRAPGRGRRRRGPGRGHGACLPAARAGRSAARPGQRARRTEGGPQAGPGPVLEDLERFEDCIECGLCLSACPVAGDPRFLGPAALAAAERVLEEPRGADPRAVLGLVDDAHGAWRCHTGVRMLGRLPGRGRPGRGDHAAAWPPAPDRLPRLVGKYHQEVRHDPGRPPRRNPAATGGRDGSTRAGVTWAPGPLWPTGSLAWGWSPTCICTW